MPIDRVAALKQAEKLLRQGRIEGAIAEYVRLVEDQPRDWGTVNALGDLYARAGQPERAVEQYVRVADDLMAQGYLPRAAAIYKKVLRLQFDHEHTQLQLAEIAAETGLFGDAKFHLKQVAQRRRARHDVRGATEILVRLGLVDPDDVDAKVTGARAAREIGEVGTAATLLRQAAEIYEKQHRSAEALQAFAEALEIDPATSGDDPRLLLLLASREFQAGRLDEGQAALTRLLSVSPDRRGAAVAVGRELAEQGKIEAAFVCLDLVADLALLDHDWPGAAAALQTLVDRAPTHRAALIKLVEICVDGQLTDLMIPTQQRLADAYLATGDARQARVVAEDLVTRQPEPANIERLRRALSLLREPDPEGVVERLLAAEPFETNEVMAAGPPPPPRAPLPPPPAAQQPPDVSGPPAGVRDAQEDEEKTFVLEDVEVDLSDLLTELTPATPPPPTPPWAAAAGSESPAPDLETVFETMRETIGSQADAQRQYEAGLAQLHADRLEDAILAFEEAARFPVLRFLAAAQLGRVHMRRGDLRSAVEWLERAVEAPAPAPEEGHRVLFELADSLEALGEHARALAILFELEADAPGYEDVRARIQRLSRAQTGG